MWLLLYGSAFVCLNVCVCMCVAPRFCPDPALHPCPDPLFVHPVVSFMEIPDRNIRVVSAVASVRTTTSFELCKDG